MTHSSSVLSLDVGTYVPHSLHRDQRTWAESNCYVDLWIEMLHAQKLEPLACLAFTLSADFEGDQWTFFKPPLGELSTLYGVEVLELNIWRNVLSHVVEQAGRKRLVIVEVDSFYLPDVSGTSYRTEHTKTSIGVEHVDAARETLRYFHNAGYHALEGADFRGVFRLDAAEDDTYLPPYVEFAKLDRVRRLPDRELVKASLELLGKHLRLRPRENPLSRYKARFAADLEWLKQKDMAEFHRYAFATLRQCGACYELGALYLRWLAKTGEADLEAVALELDKISDGAKALQFKTARAVNGKRAVEFESSMATMEAAWDVALERLSGRYA